jgi:tetrahydromethanopterin S-methyltransferase subunit C
MDVLAAQVWHFWIAPLIVAAALGLVIATIIGYVVKVIRPRYPRD